MNLKKDLKAALDAVDYKDCHSGDIGYKEAVLACTRFIRDHAPALLKLLEEHEALAAKLESGFIAPDRLSRDQAEPLCELEGGCERTGECHGDCECNSKVIEAWDKLRALLKENSDET